MLGLENSCSWALGSADTPLVTARTPFGLNTLIQKRLHDRLKLTKVVCEQKLPGHSLFPEVHIMHMTLRQLAIFPSSGDRH